MNPPRLAVFGGSFNPPGLHHRRIAEALQEEFDHIVVFPCGPRPDKPDNDDVEPLHRATMVDLAFAGLPKVDICLDDLEAGTFTRTHELQARYSAHGEVWHVVGADLVIGGGEGQSFVHRVWENAEELWRTLNYVVLARPGYDFAPGDLPPRARVLRLDVPGSSTEVREKIFHHENVAALVPPAVGDYLVRYGLYRGLAPLRASRRVFKEPRLMVVADEWNAKAMAWAEKFRHRETAPHEANCILVIGGDGSMLRAIRRHWRRRLPFLGLNAGHLGFLLNEAGPIFEHGLEREELLLRQMPLLHVEACGTDGAWRQDYAFNEAWVERSTGQTAWLEVSVGGHLRFPKLVCDGALLSTPAGSTAYARSMGATPLLADTPAWLLVGSNVMSPMNWRSAILSPDANVAMRGLDLEKRPLIGFVDGVPQGPVTELRARVSRIAAVELAFLSSHDMAEKLAAIQFPREALPI